MDVLIISNFGGTYSKNDNDRFLYLANLLKDEHDVEILTSDFCHEKKMHRNMPENKWSFKITFVHELGYRKNVCIKRFLSHFIWGINVRKYLNKRKKPDVVYMAVPSLTGSALVTCFCKKNNVKSIIDVQDLWPEAFKLIFNVPLISKIVFSPFAYLANCIYRHADKIVAVSETYLKRALMVNKKSKENIVIYLGTELNSFDINKKIPIACKKNNDEIWLAYCGTLGSSYDLTIVFDALSIIKSKGKKIPKFIIMGDGPLKEQFESYAEEKGLDTWFTGRLSYDKMCALLYKCDIAVNPIKHGAAQSIINKHADYVASGIPIVSTQLNNEFRNLIENYDMGYNCDNVQELAEAIFKLMEDDNLRRTMGQNARKCAEEKFDRNLTYLEIINLIIT